jgi:predicted O-methyltransferase YrrM
MLDVERVGAATLRNLTSGNRYHRVHRALADWVHIYQNELPVRYSVDLWPELRGMTVDVTLQVGHDFDLPDGERVLLGGLTKLLRPSVIFEFGTFTGSTTKLLADSAPDAVVHTIDLPDNEFTWDPWIAQRVGETFRSDAKYAKQIVQHRANTRRFEFTPFHGQCQLVFIDASHQYEDVLLDSEVALKLLSPTGLLVWDDYQAGTPGVVRALNELAGRGVQIVRLARSRLAVHRRTPFDSLPKTNPAPWTRV